MKVYLKWLVPVIAGVLTVQVVCFYGLVQGVGKSGDSDEWCMVEDNGDGDKGAALGQGNQEEKAIEDREYLEDMEDQPALEDMYQGTGLRLSWFERFLGTMRVGTEAIEHFWANPTGSQKRIRRFLEKNPTVKRDFMDGCFTHPSNPQGTREDVITDEAGLQEKLKEYKNFNEFFYRKLSERGEVRRPLDGDPNVVTSMADCNLFVIPHLDDTSAFFVKECKFDLKTFIMGDVHPWLLKKSEKERREQYVQDYQGGTLLLFRLAPHNYHRFHVPFDCELSEVREISGGYESVNPIAYTPTVQPLTKNKRSLLILKSAVFGDVLCEVVGAMGVGSIHFALQSTANKTARGTKGQELGWFAFGGSSIVLIFKKGVIKVDDRFVENSHELLDWSATKGLWTKAVQARKKDAQARPPVPRYPETPVNVGERIACTGG